MFGEILMGLLAVLLWGNVIMWGTLAVLHIVSIVLNRLR